MSENTRPNPLYRRLPWRLLQEKWQGDRFSDYERHEEEHGSAGILLPEVEQWCIDTFGKLPPIFFYDAYEFETGIPCFMIWFRSEADAMAFKLRWSQSSW